MINRSISVLLAIVLAGCASMDTADAGRGQTALPPMRWDHVPDGQQWTEATLTAIEDHGMALAELVPADIDAYCPAYAEGSEEDRKAFWAGLLSTLAKHESTWRETAVGGGGRWFGLVQISPGTARAYGCEARSGTALLDGPQNLSCAVRIMSSTVPRDGVISAGMRGVAADWGPFHSSRKREDMKSWSRGQTYCQTNS